MKKNFIKKSLVAVVAIAFAVVGLVAGSRVVKAAGETSFSVSPMSQNIVLNPGDTYRGSFKVSNPGSATEDFSYSVSITPFYVKTDADYTPVYDEMSDRTMIANWITLVSPSTGTVAPNNSDDVEFVINVPNDAPAGGQYATLTVTTVDDPSGEDGGTGIHEKLAIAHIVFAEIAGETKRSGEILEPSVPGIIFSGDLKASAKVKNTGNVHGKATYKLQVYPLFSDEEVYSNEENPATHTILPDRTLYNETSWDGTPSFGIYNVVYTVEFENAKTEVKKLVIKCPIWMLFSILFAIIAAIIYLGLKIKSRRR